MSVLKPNMLDHTKVTGMAGHLYWLKAINALHDKGFGQYSSYTSLLQMDREYCTGYKQASHLLPEFIHAYTRVNFV